MNKLSLNLLLLSVVIPQVATYADAPDTLQIAPVMITKTRTDFYSEDIKSILLDSMELDKNFTVNLGELLMQSSTLSVLNYGGSSSVTSISFRGTGSNHTLVTWNGFPVNSLTTGGVDLSLVPVEFFEKVSLVYGSSGSLYGSSSVGGSIMLENNADWNNKINGGLSVGTGSFGYQRYGLRFDIGNNRIQYRIAGFYRQSRDDFWFRDTEKSGNPKEKLDHNKSASYGILHDLSIKLPGSNSIELGLWQLRKEKEIPEIMGSYGVSNQIQKDSLLKTYIKWHKRTARSTLVLKSAYLMDFLRYTDKLYPEDEHYIIDSKIKSHRILSDANLRFYLNNLISFDVGGACSYLSVNTHNYETGQNEIHGDIFGGVKAQTGNLVANITLRKVFTPYRDPGLLYSAGIKISSESNRLTGRLNFSNKFRIPGFNEKYWQPGGNPDLQPEKGWGINIGAEWLTWQTDDKTGYLHINADIYTSRIRNWIQWIPSSVSGIWNPVNFKEVWARGFESSLNISKKWAEFTCRLKTGYAYTRSTNENSFNGLDQEGNQLKYVPVHSANSSFNVSYKQLYVTYYGHYTGARFTTEENDPTEKMDPYFVSNLLIGTSFGKKENILLQFRITNLFNVGYQVIQSYPMPGRAFYVNFSTEIGENIKEHTITQRRKKHENKN